MPTTYHDQLYAIRSRLGDNWNTGLINGLLPYVPEVRYQGDVKRTPQGKERLPPTDKYWLRLSTRGVDENQRTFRTGDVAPADCKRYRVDALLFVQVFAPKSEPQGFDKGAQLAELVQGLFRGYTDPNGIWFNRVRINEVPNEANEPWYQWNVISNYTYDVLD